MPKLEIVTVDDTKYEVLATLDASRVENVDYVKSLYFGSDTVLQNGRQYLICRKVINAEFKEIKKRAGAVCCSKYSNSALDVGSNIQM